MVLQYCKDLDADHIYSSAKTGKGVSECFLRLTKAMLAQRNSKNGKGGRGGASTGGSVSSRPKQNTVLIADDDDFDQTRANAQRAQKPQQGSKTKEKGGCCK